MGFPLLAVIVLLTFMTVVWAISVPLRDASIVDVAWPLTFLTVATLGVAAGDGTAARRWLVFVLVAVWSLRLAWHIWHRNRGRGEDYRYRTFRQKYGPDRYWWISLFQVFWLQGLIAFAVSLPLQAVAVSDAPAGLIWLDAVAVAVWLFGFVFEAVGDAQLTAFKADPANAGKVMDRGLWRYTRHPNYFGDATLWWGYGLLALATPAWWTGIVGPAVMTFMLLRVSGVAMLERTIGERRRGYAEYVRRTSSFFPLPPKRGRVTSRSSTEGRV